MIIPYKLAGTDKAEIKNVELGGLRARVFGPHYFSLSLFDQSQPNGVWAKSHSNSLLEDLEVSLVIPHGEEHSTVANLRCEKTPIPR